MTQRMTRHDYQVREEIDDLVDELTSVTAERDALRAQLDAMTTETRRPGLASGLPILQRRLVGPWVEVTD